MLTMPVLQWHLIAALVEPTLADAHDVGPAVEPTPAGAHDAGPAVASNRCLGGACPS